MKNALTLLSVLLLLFACGQKPSSGESGLVGSWAMGPITEPSSSLPEQFSAEAWAAQIPPGGLFTLSPGGAVIGAEGGWTENTLRLFWTKESAKGLVLKFEIQGRYDPASDTIQASLTQSVQFGPDPFTMRGELIMTRVRP